MAGLKCPLGIRRTIGQPIDLVGTELVIGHFSVRRPVAEVSRRIDDPGVVEITRQFAQVIRKGVAYRRVERLVRTPDVVIARQDMLTEDVGLGDRLILQAYRILCEHRCDAQEVTVSVQSHHLVQSDYGILRFPGPLASPDETSLGQQSEEQGRHVDDLSGADTISLLDQVVGEARFGRNQCANLDTVGNRSVLPAGVLGRRFADERFRLHVKGLGESFDRTRVWSRVAILGIFETLNRPLRHLRQLGEAHDRQVSSFAQLAQSVRLVWHGENLLYGVDTRLWRTKIFCKASYMPILAKKTSKIRHFKLHPTSCTEAVTGFAGQESLSRRMK